jgi:hypothetical protein
VTVHRSLLGLLLAASSLVACGKPITERLVPPRIERQPARKPSTPVAWGIPRFFEVGRHVQLHAGGPPVDTTGWPDAFLRASAASARPYLSAAADDRSTVFIYPELDPSERLRRYALVVPEPKTFATNGLVTAFWGRSPLLMNFALGAARSFASFTSVTPQGSRRVIPLRARLQPSGVNPQDSENVYELEDSRFDVFEHKGLIPGEPLSFSEFVVYDRDSVTDDSEPTKVHASVAQNALSVGLIPLRDARWLHRESFESNGCRVVLVRDQSGNGYFLATPLELQPRWGFGEVTTDLTLGQLESADSIDVGPGSAAALTLEHATQGWFLSGVVQSKAELPALLERGARFLVRQEDSRRELAFGVTPAFAARAAHAFVAAHRSQREPRTLTRFAHGDALQPSNSTAFSAGMRYGQDLAGAVRGLISVQRASGDAALLSPVADFAESSLTALLPSGATLARRFDQLALMAEHDEPSGRSDVFLDNGSIAVGINHRRLLLASAETHLPSLTWGAFGATINGHGSSVDEANYEFGVDGGSLPHLVSANDTTIAVSRLFTPESGLVRIRETARLLRGFPAVGVLYQLESRSERPEILNEARITLADFLEYGTGANETSQNHYGFGHIADGVRLPVGFWMEGMKAPIWGDNLAPGEFDLTELYRSLGARFLLVYGYDRAQIYYLSRPADRLILHNGRDGEGLTRVEVRYQPEATLPSRRAYDLPEVFSYTLRAPLASVDGDAIPDQLQELAPLWTRIVAREAQVELHAPPALETDSGHAELVYSWILAADLLQSTAPTPQLAALATRLEQSALRGSAFALSAVSELRNQNDFLPTYASGHDYGFHLAIFDWAYRETCDVRYRDAFLSLADDLTRAETRGGLQISDPESPSYGGYLSTQQSRASGATRVGDQGIRLWALRIAYERTGAVKYRRSAELFLNHWLRLDSEAHSFTGTVLVEQRYRDAEVAQERSPLGHYSVLAGLKAWSDILPRARQLYAAGLGATIGRKLVHGVGLTGPRRLIIPRAGVADFSDDAELGGSFLWATTLEPSALGGRFTQNCRPIPQALTSTTGTH